MRYILGCVRRAIEDFKMIKEGDKIAVGVSGGKDSMVLLKAMHLYRHISKVEYELHAITIDLGLSDAFDTTPVKKLCEEWNIPYHVVKTNIGKIIFESRQETNPCSLCSRMRRGSIHDECKKHGINKIALGHHREDVVETFLMSLLYEGRINTFSPLTWMDRADIVQIRPMVYAPEKEVIKAAQDNKLPIIKSPCPADKDSKRQDMKQLLKTLDGYRKDGDAAKYLMLAITKTDTYHLWDDIKRRPGE
ncbi:MAG: tRNA lysidine(34) synthetase TilS [Eubacteriales bacterium]